MRALVFFLVFANLAAFVLSGGVGGQPPAPAADDGRAHAQLSPDRIRIVSKGEPPRVTTPAEPSCLAWLDLPAEAADKLQAAVAAESALKLRREEVSLTRKSYWIHIPSNGTGRPGAERKILELKQLGVKDYSLMTDPGIDQWAISLGLYSSEDPANAALAGLRQKGVRSARLAARERTVHASVWRVTGPAEKVEPLRGVFAERQPRACAELVAPTPSPAAQGVGVAPVGGQGDPANPPASAANPAAGSPAAAPVPTATVAAGAARAPAAAEGGAR